MKKSTRPCNFIYFHHQNGCVLWASMCSTSTLYPGVFPVNSSFANLYYDCWISSMLTWWKVSFVCYTVLSGFTISILHFICSLFVGLDCCFSDCSSILFSSSLHFLSMCANMGYPSESLTCDGNFLSLFCHPPTKAI